MPTAGSSDGHNARAGTKADAAWQAEAALREASDRLQAIIDASPLAIITLTPDGTVETWNPGAERIYGWRAEEVIGEITPVIFDADRAAFEHRHQLILSGETTSGVEARGRRRDGSAVEVEVSTAPLHDASGQVSGALYVAADISRRKRAEEEHSRLAAILEATTDFVATLDPSGQVLYLNQAGRKMLWIDPAEEVRGLHASELYPEGVEAFAVRQGIPAAVRDGVWSGETALRSRTCRSIPVSQVTLAHRAADGQVQFLSVVARDISERKQFEAQLVHLADHDPLTGLFNRRRFQEELEMELAQSRRYGTRGAVLFLDLDDFKDINDSLGHRAGDTFLSSVAHLLRERLRASDVLARLGGDEFAVLLPHADAEHARGAAAQVLERVRQHTLVIGGHILGVTASIGISLFPEHGTTTDELVAQADLAMYQAKGQGGNCFHTYNPATGC